MQQDEQQGALSPGRLEAFSDGVIAVIITIMVLELKVPHEAGLAGLREILPILAVYALSFVFVGIYWVNHHVLIARVRFVDPLALYSNLVFLFSLSLLPFFTAWVLEKDHSVASVQLYTGSLIASGMGFMLLRVAVERRLRLEHRLLQQDRRSRVRHWFSIGLYAVSLALAVVHPSLALLLDAAVTVIWIIPGLVFRRESIAAESHEA